MSAEAKDEACPLRLPGRTHHDSGLTCADYSAYCYDCEWEAPTDADWEDTLADAHGHKRESGHEVVARIEWEEAL